MKKIFSLLALSSMTVLTACTDSGAGKGHSGGQASPRVVKQTASADRGTDGHETKSTRSEASNRRAYESSVINEPTANGAPSQEQRVNGKSYGQDSGR